MVLLQVQVLSWAPFWRSSKESMVYCVFCISSDAWHDALAQMNFEGALKINRLNHHYRGTMAKNNCTGPNRPAGSSGVAAVSLRMLVRVSLCSFGWLASPIMRLGQKFTTAISNLFLPAFIALEMSMRNGGDQTTPRFFPLR